MFVYETIYFTNKKINIYQYFNEGFEYTIKFKFNYIYIYIYVERERERERESQTWLNSKLSNTTQYFYLFIY